MYLVIYGCSVVALDHVRLNSVENEEPHGRSKKLGTPFHLGVHMWFTHWSMTDVLCNVVSCHFNCGMLGESCALVAHQHAGTLGCVRSGTENGRSRGK